MSHGRPFVSLTISIVLAAVAFVGFVLPAEYDVDPIGLGALLGIKGMSNEVRVQALSLRESAALDDRAEFELAPFESVEYKYEMTAGAGMVFDWSAEGELVFDLHSEEQGTDPEDSVTFAAGRDHHQSGVFTAPFGGRHGWFWENRGASTVTVRLQSRGHFDAGIVYSPAGEFRKELGSNTN